MPLGGDMYGLCPMPDIRQDICTTSELSLRPGSSGERLPASGEHGRPLVRDFTAETAHNTLQKLGRYIINIVLLYLFVLNFNMFFFGMNNRKHNRQKNLF